MWYGCRNRNHPWTFGNVVGRRLINPNYAVFDSGGNLYVNDSGYTLQNHGFIFVIRSDGVAQVLTAEIAAFPKDMALSADNSTGIL